MSLKAGFAETDITPPEGLRKIGYLRLLYGMRTHDPLHARVAVFEANATRIAFVQLDTLSIRWTQVAQLRELIAHQHGIPPRATMVAATHTHGSPAVANLGDVKREDAYINDLIPKLAELVTTAINNMQPAEIGFNSVFEWGLAWNRRVVMRDGLVKTHASFNNPEALFIEGPVDPEVAVLAAKNPDGRLLGCIVNFACHPTHHGDSDEWSAGYPGALATAMKARNCPVTLFLNGACGNVHHANPAKGGASLDADTFGGRLADDAARAIEGMTFKNAATLGAKHTTLQLPFRKVTDAEISGAIAGAQRFVNPAIYDRGIPELLRKMEVRKTNPAEVQALKVGDVAFAAIPAEYFVEFGLRIKEQAWPVHALVASHANGMLGYVPTPQAFKRGGYETTFAPSSRLAPEAGDMLADAAVKLIRELSTS